MNLVALVLLAIVVAVVAFMAGRRRAVPAERPEPSESEQLASIPGVWLTDANGSGTWLSEIHPEELPRFQSAIEKRQPFELEYRGQRDGAEPRWMLSCGVPRFDRDGNFCGYVGVTIDISARKRAEDLPRVAEKTPKKKKVVAEIGDEPKSAFPDLHLKQILVVDREAATLDFTAELLRQYGARVTIARSATEAILALHQHHDLVVTDNAVPVTEGVMLAQQLRQANGGLPAIVLRKPIDGAELASEIAQLLTRSGEA